ncbi:hypothetical protein E5A73_12190 [Sphingomonas gei]|uniref:Uncharacterized protein n=1 Tax=Sphingomonas gei TaxID=1395960 RepID=A0A4S1XDM8_9SPHN|nr:hypothetical protein [Sphingomonas gei]TGX53580.1 hypothetical protein E5A73_12190 [Sphingomonas gei]
MANEDKDHVATEQMFALVGRAITQWSFVEQVLCNIFTLCVTPCPARPSDGATSMIDSGVSTAVFYSIESFRGKLGLVDAALLARVYGSAVWAEDLRTEWAKLRDKTRKLSLKRNRLAHWTVIPAMSDEDRFHQARLMPPYGSPGWWRETGSNPPGNDLKPLHIQHLGKAFYLIEDRLRCFSRKLAQCSGLSDRYDQLTVRLIRSHDRLNPTRGEWIRHALASPPEF